MHFHHPAGGYQSAIQLEARMHFQVSGLVAKVKLQQSFRNDSPDWVEGEYLFPLPDRAGSESAAPARRRTNDCR